MLLLCLVCLCCPMGGVFILLCGCSVLVDKRRVSRRGGGEMVRGREVCGRQSRAAAQRCHRGAQRTGKNRKGDSGCRPGAP